MVGLADPLRLSTISTKKKLLVDEILAYGIYIDKEWEELERNTSYNKRMIEEIKHSYDHFCSRRRLKYSRVDEEFKQILKYFLNQFLFFVFFI